MTVLAELQTLISRYALPDMSTALPGVMLIAEHAPTEPMHHIVEPTFAFIAQGAKRGVLGGQVFEYRAGQYVMVSAQLPVASCIMDASPQQPFLALALTLKPATIASLLLDVAQPANLAHLVLPQQAIHISTAPAEILEPLVRLLRLLDHPEDQAVLGPMIEREIIWRLLQGDQGLRLRQIGLADSRLSQVNQAIHWIRTHYQQRLQIDAMAEHVSMSVTTFHRHFRAITAMSPLQYQKQVRLQEARGLLLAGDLDAAAAGFAVGYDSPSQFSREYRRLFGKPPGKDIASLRERSAGEQAENHWL